MKLGDFAELLCDPLFKLGEYLLQRRVHDGLGELT